MDFDFIHNYHKEYRVYKRKKAYYIQSTIKSFHNYWKLCLSYQTAAKIYTVLDNFTKTVSTFFFI